MSACKKHPVSLILSYIVCVACLAAVLPAVVLLPMLVEQYLVLYMPGHADRAGFVMAVLYVGLAIAVAVLIVLVLLLRVVGRGEIFTPKSGDLVRVIAGLVLAEGGVFALLASAILPVICLAITIVAVTMGLCFLVVGHVLHEAAAIKAENDATI